MRAGQETTKSEGPSRPSPGQMRPHRQPILSRTIGGTGYDRGATDLRLRCCGGGETWVLRGPEAIKIRVT